jgi:hypothetical protein
VTWPSVFAVIFANGTTKAFPYQVSRNAEHAATPGSPGAAAAADNATTSCCIPLSGEVAWYDSVKYSLHNSLDCHASSRVCSLPGQVSAVWVCGCPGGDCSGGAPLLLLLHAALEAAACFHALEAAAAAAACFHAQAQQVTLNTVGLP